MKKNEYSRTKIFKILNEFYLNKAKDMLIELRGRSIKIQTSTERKQLRITANNA